MKTYLSRKFGIFSILLLGTILPISGACTSLAGKALKSDSVGVPFAQNTVASDDSVVRGQYNDPSIVIPSVPSGNGSYEIPEIAPEFGSENSNMRVSTEDLETKERQLYTSLRGNRKADEVPAYWRPLPSTYGPFENRTKESMERLEPYLQVSHENPYYQPPDEVKELEEWEKEEKRFDWSKFDPSKLYTQIRDSMGMGPNEQEATRLIKEAMSIIDENPELKDKRLNVTAAKLFERAGKKWPDSLIEEDAIFLAAECWFFSDMYPNALYAYESLIVKYNNTKYMNTATRRLFSIGKYWEKLDRKGVSSFSWKKDPTRPRMSTFSGMKKAYESIFLNDPRGPLSDDAVMSLAEAYMNKGLRAGDSHFEKAAVYYSYLRENYPDSRHLGKAFERETIARKMSYIGSEYNNQALDAAEKLAEQTIMQYSGDSSVNIAMMKDISNDITEQKAARDWTYAEYYDKKKEYGAARVYYNRIVNEYSTTDYASRARKRLSEIAKLPDEPKSIEKFVEKYIPSNKFR